MGKFLVLLAICLLGHAAAAIAEEDGVLVLSENSFEGAIQSNPFILVAFFAPWCGHCKQFAPEYAAAARALKQAEPAVPLAKVDATVETKIAEDYGVRGYPTIKLFIEGRDQEYTGGRTEQNIVTWVLRKAGPPAVAIEDVASAERFEKEHSHAVIGFFAAGASREPFEAAARQVEDVMFAYSTAPVVSERYGVTPPALRMVFPHDEKVANFERDMQDIKQIETFVKAHRHPLVSTFDGESAPDIFGDGRPILFLFRERDAKGDSAEKELREAAPQLQRRALVSVAGSSEPMDQRLMDYVGVEPEDLPTIRLVENAMAGMTKYKLDGDVTAAAIATFFQNYEAGTIKPHLKSEEVPRTQPGPVYTLVGSTFEEIVKDPKKDVLVMFYAPWCGHCKKLEPLYTDVAKKLEGVSTLLIAKMDATVNDVEGVDVEGFPTIKFWRADDKDSPLEFDGDRDVNSFISWLEEKATFAFSQDELKSEL